LIGSRETINQLNDVFVLELAKQLDFTDGGKVDSFLWSLGLDFLDGNDTSSAFLFCLEETRAVTL
jgi:hypothetical protein